jgi:cell division protein ZapA
MTDKRNNQACTVQILEKEYLVACKEDERDELAASARYLDRKMREIRDSGKVIGADRIAVMAALNIAHELLTKDDQQSGVEQTYVQRLKKLQEKIEGALFHSQQMEF